MRTPYATFNLQVRYLIHTVSSAYRKQRPLRDPPAFQSVRQFAEAVTGTLLLFRCVSAVLHGQLVSRRICIAAFRTFLMDTRKQSSECCWLRRCLQALFVRPTKAILINTDVPLWCVHKPLPRPPFGRCILTNTTKRKTKTEPRSFPYILLPSHRKSHIR